MLSKLPSSKLMTPLETASRAGGENRQGSDLDDAGVSNESRSAVSHSSSFFMIDSLLMGTSSSMLRRDRTELRS